MQFKTLDKLFTFSESRGFRSSNQSMMAFVHTLDLRVDYRMSNNLECNFVSHFQ